MSEIYPDIERFTDQMTFEFRDREDDGRKVASLWLLEASPNPFTDGPVLLADGSTQGFSVPGVVGAELTDNSRIEDGYRFHDALHIAMMAKTGWSPVMRKNLGLKRRSRPDVDEIEDGGRAIVTEEGFFNALYLREIHDGRSPAEMLSLDQAANAVTSFWENHGVGDLGEKRPSTLELKRAALFGFQLLSIVAAHEGGVVEVDMSKRTVSHEAFPDDCIELGLDRVFLYYDFIQNPKTSTALSAYAEMDRELQSRFTERLTALSTN